MTIEPQSKVIDVSLELPEDFERNRNYESVVEYLLTYRPRWGNETKQVKCLNTIHAITKWFLPTRKILNVQFAKNIHRLINKSFHFRLRIPVTEQ